MTEYVVVENCDSTTLNELFLSWLRNCVPEFQRACSETPQVEFAGAEHRQLLHAMDVLQLGQPQLGQIGFGKSAPEFLGGEGRIGVEHGQTFALALVGQAGDGAERRHRLC